MTRMQDDSDFIDCHAWECPVFMLNHRNQRGLTGFSKWDPNSYVGVCLGRSPLHTSNVVLVLNLVAFLYNYI